VLLAALSIGPIFAGFNEKFFRTPAYHEAHPRAEHVEKAYLAPGAPVPHEDHPWWFSALALSLGGAGILFGASLFASGRRDEKSRLLPAGLHDLAAAKYYMDEMYLDGVVAGANRMSEVSSWTDARVVDGLVNVSGAATLLLGDVSGDADHIVVDGAVNLTADLAQGAGAAVATVQTGRIRNYLATALGVAAVVIAVLVFF
jgi:hypothetical protein